MGKRIQQVNELILRELSQIIFKEVEFPEDILVTLTRVETSVDLLQSKVYISVLPENKKRIALKILEGQIYEIQQKLNKRLNMKIVPRIIFVEEKETTTAGRIEEILERLKKDKK